MSMSAEKEKKQEDQIAGTQPGKSANFWKNNYLIDFAKMARSLRKSEVVGKPDLYTPIIERQLARIDAAVRLLESSPKLALQYGEDGKGIEDILELIERKANELEADLEFSKAAHEVLRTQPGARMNAMQIKAKKGGLVIDGGAVNYNQILDDASDRYKVPAQ